MTFKEFTKTKLFLYNVLGALLLIPIVIWITMFSISVYTKHGSSIVLPDFKNQDITKLKASEDLKIRLIVSDSVYSVGTTPGTVIEQTPLAGAEVKEGRKVFVTVASEHPKEILMPKLVNGSIRKAKLKLKRMGLTLGQISLTPSPYEDLVLSQKIDGEEVDTGEKVFIGSVVDLEVGTASNITKVDVPNLNGTKLEDAKQILANSGLSLGVVIYDGTFESVEDSLSAYVSSQKPLNTNGKVKQGSFVDIWLKSANDTIVIE